MSLAAGADRSPFTGAVLAGGASTRMGRDKALLVVGGVTLARRAALALRHAGASSVVAVGGDPVALAAEGLAPIRDEHPGDGPLGGIVTALRHAGDDVVAVLSCDLPWVTPVGVAAVVDALVAGTADVAAAAGERGIEPLHAAYRRSALPALEAAFGAGERSPRRAVTSLEVVTVTLADPRWARSANTPSELPNPAS